MNQQTLKGNWNEISGKLRSKWGELNKDEMRKFEGDSAQLIGYIQRKTGEARDKIEGFLDELVGSGAEGVSRAAEAVQDYASQAAKSARDGAEAVAKQVQTGYAAAERIVQERPASSVAAAFGVGVIVGVLLSLLLRSE
jgi:uncharacterized protein YjbJ (UPF0337 family)